MIQGDERGPYPFFARIAEVHERRRNFGMCDALTPGRIPPVPYRPSSTGSIRKPCFFGHGPIELTNDDGHDRPGTCPTSSHCATSLSNATESNMYDGKLQLVPPDQDWSGLASWVCIPRRNIGRDCEASERSEQRSGSRRRALELTNQLAKNAKKAKQGSSPESLCSLSSHFFA
jgi:hypothetical protein